MSEGLGRMLSSAPPVVEAVPLAQGDGTSSGKPHSTTLVKATNGARLQAVASRAVAEVGYRLSRVGIAGVTGLLLITSAVAVFVMINLPQRASIEALREAVGQPLAPGGAGLVAAQVGKVLSGLPPRSGAPEIIEKIVVQAKAAGVELERGQYEFIPERDGIAAHYRVQLPVKTTYPQLRAFVDKTLIALPGVGVEALRIQRKSVGDTQIEADVKLSVFVKDGA